MSESPLLRTAASMRDVCRLLRGCAVPLAPHQTYKSHFVLKQYVVPQTKMNVVRITKVGDCDCDCFYPWRWLFGGGGGGARGRVVAALDYHHHHDPSSGDGGLRTKIDYLYLRDRHQADCEGAESGDRDVLREEETDMVLDAFIDHLKQQQQQQQREDSGEHRRRHIDLDVHHNLRDYDRYFRSRGFLLTGEVCADNPYWTKTTLVG